MRWPWRKKKVLEPWQQQIADFARANPSLGQVVDQSAIYLPTYGKVFPEDIIRRLTALETQLNTGFVPRPGHPFLGTDEEKAAAQARFANQSNWGLFNKSDSAEGENHDQIAVSIEPAESGTWIAKADAFQASAVRPPVPY